MQTLVITLHYFAKAIKGTIYAFEPDLENFNLLEKIHPKISFQMLNYLIRYAVKFAVKRIISI